MNTFNGLTVSKRDGRIVNFKIDSIRTAIEWAVEGLDLNPLELESSLQLRIKDKISTKLIQDSLVECAISLTTAQTPDWRYVAGRMQMWTYIKTTSLLRGFGYGDYQASIKYLIETGKYARDVFSVYSSELDILSVYSIEELKEAGSWINPDRDKDYDIAGTITLTKKYLLPGELPQEAFLTIALMIATVEAPPNRLKVAHEIYDAVSLRKISLATPILGNMRTPNGSASSCFIIGVDDSLDSIFSNITNAACISRAGGGVGINLSRVRAKGSWVNGRPNSSKGITSWTKLFNDTAISVDQGGKRSGAFTISTDIWHLDTPDFLEIQTEAGDQRFKSYDIFPQLVIPDEFMRRVINNQKWTLIDPYEVRSVLNFELAELWGEEFEKAYSLIESEVGNSLKLFKVVDAKTLFKQIMKTQMETGVPYITFKDTINRANPNKHDGYIPSSNLCVAGETKILTKDGYQEIQSLSGRDVELWNGEEWSLSKVFKTGEDQELIKINFSNGESIECTPYHKFWIQDKYTAKAKKIEAKNLNPEDKLIRFNLPVIEGYNECSLELFNKGLVPDVSNTIESRLGWLAELIDNNGYKSTKSNNSVLVIRGVNLSFLKEVRLMLQTLGIDSKIVELNLEWSLIISSNGIYQLHLLYLQSNGINLRHSIPHIEDSEFIEVVSVEHTGRVSDTYCFTEPKRNMGMFNGILAGNCVESFSNVSPDTLSHTCNLNSLNLANIEDEEFPKIAKLAVRILDNLIDLTATPIKESKAHNNRYRTIGVGAMGLADYLAKRKKTYRDLDTIKELFEKFAYYTTLSSVELAKERGVFEAYKGSEWDKGLLINSKSLAWFMDNAANLTMKKNWVILHNMIKTYGIRNSHIQAIAPNTTSSLLQGCSASILPVFSKFYFDHSGKGSIPIAPPFINQAFWFYQENKTVPQNLVVDAVATIQLYVDTGISMELLWNLNEGMYNGGTLTAKDIYETLISAWLKGCKTIYYQRSVQKDSTKQKEDCVSCAN